MSNEHNKKTVQEKILQAIKAGEVTMRPRWHFVLRSILLGTGVVLVAFTLLYLMSFIIFVLHRNGVWFVPTFGFGFRTLSIFLFSLPWLLILVSLFFIAVLEVLVRQYSFTYRRPLLYSALGIIIFVVLGGFAVAQTPLHSHFFSSAQENNLPFAGGLYRGFGMERVDKVYPCVILQVTDHGFVAKDSGGDQVEVVITPETRFPFGTDFSVGDRVLVIGDRASSTITAAGVRVISDLEQNRTHGPRMRVHFLNERVK